jgi:hypothetical protein
LSILIIHSPISDTFSAKIAETISGLFLDNTTFGLPVSLLETSATYRKNLEPGE